MSKKIRIFSYTRFVCKNACCSNTFKNTNLYGPQWKSQLSIETIRLVPADSLTPFYNMTTPYHRQRSSFFSVQQTRKTFTYKLLGVLTQSSLFYFVCIRPKTRKNTFNYMQSTHANSGSRICVFFVFFHRLGRLRLMDFWHAKRVNFISPH